MNLLLERAGLSARRKTIEMFRIDRSILAALIAIPLLMSSCSENTKGQTADDKKITAGSADSLNKPKVNIQVNKHYDDKGNVIGFDSTYTSFYSNVQGDTMRMDSLMGSFDKYFSKDYSSIFKNEFNSLFFNDSSRNPDFFHNDYFLKRYELNDHYFRDMMNRMDSIKNRFYEQHSYKGDKNTGDL
jgi:hypothetical protein